MSSLINEKNSAIEPRVIFLTGSTGTLGKELVKRFLWTTQDRLVLLIRSQNRHSHWDRVRKMLSAFDLEIFLGSRVQVLNGDVSQPDLGLSVDELGMLREQTTDFFHVAALTALNGSESDCYRINLDGTIAALKLASDFWERGKLRRFYYFSTAYVAGSLQNYVSYEDELP
ncbi:MAG: SDR family oxidoreductase, partial [Candidatus Omnitrophica bacterium]|nr:SDR family oxidoreductase [Candidatus Omnitrophota bacterium]